jgi:hypothetical protein
MNWKGLAFACALISGSVMAGESMIVRFDLTDSMKTFLKQNEFDVTGVNYKTMEIEALLTEAELERIKAQKTQIKFSFPQNLAMAPDQNYLNPQEIEDFLRGVHAQYPDITEIKSIGKSLEGRDIWAMKISDNVRDDEVEPSILVNGMHHAREVMTPEITTDMISYLTSNYGKDETVTRWVNDTEIWVVPMFNVDGNNKMWTEDSMWRKNTRDGHGVDLNRNYPYGWNTCRGSSASTGAQDYRGTAPASEPETQAMMNFVSEIKPVFNISYHSYSEIVIYPYGCRPNRTPAEEAVEAVGTEIAKKIDYKPGTAWELLYNADGGDIDWMYTAHQVIPFVIEVNGTWDGFHPNYKRMRDKTVLRNRPGWQHLFTRLEGPSIQGRVSQKSFDTIRIMKAGDAKVAQTYKINPDGSFYVILKAGTYDVSFEGSRSKKIENLSVQTRQVMNL